MSKSVIFLVAAFFMTTVALAGPAKIKLFTIDLPEGFDGPITQASGPIEMIAFVKLHEGRETTSLIQFSIINLDKAPPDSVLQSATVTNKKLLLKISGINHLING